ncbi:MAG: host-nuclease inhibitor Gam family protein [Candidatus Gastranaerophilales bacterium]|nr:host-nuclease inhibitor Gam family protein [Candidatus Gastranaerophilales bacterium]
MTKKLPNGIISCRVSNRIEIPDENKTMEILRKLNLTHCITVSELLNKNVLKTLDEKTLNKAKISVVKENKFSIKTNHSDLKTV